MPKSEPVSTVMLEGLIEVYYPRSQERVNGELQRIREKRASLRKFGDKIRNYQDVDDPSQFDRFNVDPIVSQHEGEVEPSASIIKLFIDSMQEYYDESLEDRDDVLEIMAEEFNESLVTHLIKANVLSEDLKSGLQNEIEKATNTLDSLEAAILTEKDSLNEVEKTIQKTVCWVAEHQNRHLMIVDYNELVDVYEEIEYYIELLDELSEKRQEDIRKSTIASRFGITQADLIDILYADFPVDYPILRDIASTANEVYNHKNKIEKELSNR